MQVKSYFIHLIMYNTMVKIEFKMNIICVRLIIFKYFIMQDYVGIQ
jgi:hypothetical protein